jgi:integrase/recombinase XerD
MKTLQKAVEEYLALRCGLGFKLERDKILLGKFVSYLKQKRASHITIKDALNFAKQCDARPSHWGTRLGVIRRFALYWRATDPRTEIPPLGLFPTKYDRAKPYIYSKEEIIHLAQEALKLSSNLGLRPKTYSTLFALLAVTGMRISEVIALDDEDVDLNEEILKVRLTKFGKSRLVPIHSTTADALKAYTQHRNKIFPHRKTTAFFVSEKDTRVTQWSIRYNFVLVSERIGLRKITDSYGPRIHDMRHAFAVSTLIRWYRRGLNVDEQIPLLSTFLGHAHPTDTYWYLSAAPELLGLAASRLEKQLGGTQ